jgi:hypothetical protein
MVAQVLIKRTSTNNSPPLNLQPGELAVEMGVPTRLWVGVPIGLDPSGRKQLTPSAGGVTVSDDPKVSPEQGDLWFESDTGILWMWYEDINSQQWVQVNGSSSNAISVAETPPASPIPGELWYESDTGILWMSYNDGNSTQWVQVNGIGGSGADAYTKAESDANYVNVVGDAMSGGLTVTTDDPFITFNKTAGGHACVIQAMTEGVIRWNVQLNNYNTDDFAIYRFVNGVYTDAPFGILNATGAANFTGTVNVNGGLSAGGTGLNSNPTAATHAFTGTGGADGTGGVLAYTFGGLFYAYAGFITSGVAYSYYGTAGAYIASGTWATSDAALKTVTRSMDVGAALAAVNSIAVKHFTPVSDNANGLLTGTSVSSELFGWIAQEVETVIPTAVRDVTVPDHDLLTRSALKRIPMPEKGTPEADALSGETLSIKAINDRYMVATLWAAVQALSAEVNALKTQIGAR